MATIVKCISSRELSKNSIKFSLSNAEQRDSWLNSSHQTLAADKTDGQMKRMNQDLEQYLRMFIDYQQKQWLDQLAIAKFAYNNKVQTSTKVLLFKANNGRDPCMGFEMKKKGKFKKAKEFTTRIEEVHKKAEATLKKS